MLTLPKWRGLRVQVEIIQGLRWLRGATGYAKRKQKNVVLKRVPVARARH